MIEAIETIVIDKPISQVFEYTTNPQNAEVWYDNVKKSEYALIDGKVVPGSKATLRTNIMGKDFDFTYNIDVLTDNERMLMKTEAGPFPMESEYTFKAIDATHTEVTIINRATPKGVPSFMLSMVKGKVQKTIAESVANLKKIVEAL